MTKKALFAAAIVAGFAATGCKKDKVSVGEKLAGTWDVTEYRVGTESFVDNEISVILVFDADGDFAETIRFTYSYNGTTYSYEYPFSGQWTSADNDLDLDFSPNTLGAQELGASPSNSLAYSYNDYTENYDIIELTEAGKLSLQTSINGKTVAIKATKR